jgi:transposase
MNVPNKFVKTLSKEEHTKLVENHQTASSFRVRNRSHAILLSAQGYSIDTIANIYQVHRTAVSRWINWWNELGWEGLADFQRGGRPKILTAQEEEKAIELALQNPRFPHRQMAEIVKETGKEISIYTLKDLLKKRLSVEKNQTRTLEKD